jgi:hypothetical protein
MGAACMKCLWREGDNPGLGWWGVFIFDQDTASLISCCGSLVDGGRQVLVHRRRLSAQADAFAAVDGVDFETRVRHWR